MSFDSELHENFGCQQNDPNAIDKICSNLARDDESMTQTKLEELIFEQEAYSHPEREPTNAELERIEDASDE